MRLHPCVQFVGVHRDLLEQLIADGVGRVGAESHVDQLAVLGGVVQLQPLVDILVAVARPDGGEVEDGESQLAADPRFASGSGHLVGEKVHVGEAGGSGANHLRDGQLAAVADEFLAQPAALGGPDMLL